MLPSPLIIIIIILLLILLTLSAIIHGTNPPATLSLLTFFYYHGASTLESLVRSCHGRWNEDTFHCALQGGRVLAMHGVVYYASGEGAAALRAFSGRRSASVTGGRDSAEVMERRIRGLNLVEKARELEEASTAPDGMCLTPRREMEDAMTYSSAGYACPATSFRYGNGWFSYTDGARVKIWCTALCRADRAGCYEFGERIGHDIVGMTHRYGMTGSLVWWNEIGTREVAKCRVVRLKPAE